MKTNLKRVVCAMVFATGLGVHATASAAIDLFFDTLGDETLKTGSYVDSPLSHVEYYENADQLFGTQFFPVGDWMASSFYNNDSHCTPCQLNAITLKLMPIGGSITDASKLSLSIYEDFSWDASGISGDYTGTPLGSMQSVTPVQRDNTNEVIFTPTSNIFLENGPSYTALLESNETAGGQWDWMYGVPTSGADRQWFPGFVPVVDDPDYPYAMKVEASPSTVPIPGALWLMGSALLGFVLQGRRGKL